MRMLFFLTAAVVLIAGCTETSPVPSARVPANSNTATPVDSGRPARDTAAPDNTAVNQRDANANTKTPIDQNENQADVNLTAKIRREVLNVKDLSVDARNAKIITADGKVTLRGPVKSPEERDTIDRIARAAAGEGNVDNQLEVATSTTTTNPGR